MTQPQARLVIAGGSGFIGRSLAREFSGRGFAVVVLTRSPRPRTDGVLEVAWDGATPGPWTAQLEGVDAVINLTGKNINCPHTPENLRDIAASRINSVNAIATALEGVQTPPRVWVQASAAGFYGNDSATLQDESSPPGHDPLAKLCLDWEGAFTAARVRTRKVVLRIGFVLGHDGGVLPILSRMTRCFLGGTAGHGRQYISWIHLADLTAMAAAAVTNETLSGTFNAVGPNPATNAEFMRELRRSWHRPWCPPAPAVVVKLGARLMGSEASLALTGQRCAPRRFLAAGFQFRFPELPGALQDLCHP